MNQILAVENNKNEDNNINNNSIPNTTANTTINPMMNSKMNQPKGSTVKTKTKIKRTRTGKPIEIEGIIKFFLFALICFGVVFVGQGSYAIYKSVDDRKPANIPSVVIGRVNDRAIVRVEHNTEISKLIYSWDNGVETAIPIGSTRAEEEIILVGYDSVLNIIVEDTNGKRVKFQKVYKLTGVDITKPSIEIETEDGKDKMTIVARDETEISYLSYQWDDEEPVVIDATQEGQKEIQQVIDLQKGTRQITVIAEDLNGNVEQQVKTVTATSKPKLYLNKSGSTITIEVTDVDGIKDIEINLNGQVLSKQDVNKTTIKTKPLQLKQGNNTISVKVTNVNGYTANATKEITYNP